MSGWGLSLTDGEAPAYSPFAYLCAGRRGRLKSTSPGIPRPRTGAIAPRPSARGRSSSADEAALSNSDRRRMKVVFTGSFEQEITADLIIDHRAEDKLHIRSCLRGGVMAPHLRIAAQQETDDVGIQQPLHGAFSGDPRRAGCSPRNVGSSSQISRSASVSAHSSGSVALPSTTERDQPPPKRGPRGLLLGKDGLTFHCCHGSLWRASMGERFVALKLAQTRTGHGYHPASSTCPHSPDRSNSHGPRHQWQFGLSLGYAMFRKSPMLRAPIPGRCRDAVRPDRPTGFIVVDALARGPFRSRTPHNGNHRYADPDTGQPSRRRSTRDDQQRRVADCRRCRSVPGAVAS